MGLFFLFLRSLVCTLLEEEKIHVIHNDEMIELEGISLTLRLNRYKLTMALGVHAKMLVCQSELTGYNCLIFTACTK